jgi:hypothetical protein
MTKLWLLPNSHKLKGSKILSIPSKFRRKSWVGDKVVNTLDKWESSKLVLCMP